MKKHGFTLIELLIVVAIIAILAAIAVPNFLEAQTRAKVSRAKSDMRAIAVGLQAYTVDNNKMPPANAWNMGFGLLSMYYAPGKYGLYCVYLTSPVAYMTSIPEDPFDILHPYGYQHCSFWYVNLKEQANNPKLVRYNGEMQYEELNRKLTSSPRIHVNGKGSPYRRTSFVMGSAGPKRNFAALQALSRYPLVTEAFINEADFPASEKGTGGMDTSHSDYDPSNGTVSDGTIYCME